MKLYHNIGKLYTPRGRAAMQGHAMRELETFDNAAILVGEDGRIITAGPLVSEGAKQSTYSSEKSIEFERIDCRGLVALPGFVDSHTHAVFAGERSAEFAMRAEGRSYQEIARAGGGIAATVDRVRSTTAEEIAKHSLPFLKRALKLGTTTIEIKSGYGLSLKEEEKLLDATVLLQQRTPMEIVKSFLGAHAVPKNISQANYLKDVLEKQLPALHTKAEFCDVFMDEGYFTREETILICEKAKALGMKIKLHADELAETGGARTAVELGAYSADHLLKVSEDGIQALAGSERTVATLLPITAMSLREPYAPARRMIEAGCAIAIATDCNPGSSMSENMQFAMTLAVIGMQMTPAEALTAATLNGAAALDRARTHGSIERNKMADFVLYDIPCLEYLPYHIAVSNVAGVVKHGTIVEGNL